MKKLLSVLIILTFSFLCISCQKDNSQNESNKYESNQNEKPFLVVLEKANIIEEPTQHLEDDGTLVPGIGTSKRMEIVISITNEDESAYNNTKYKVAFNEEAGKFIASGVLERESDPFYMLPKGTEVAGMKNGLVEVTGFVDDWTPLITQEEDLKEYSNLEFDDIYEYVKSYTVTITWDGGMQEEILPIKLKDMTQDSNN